VARRSPPQIASNKVVGIKVISKASTNSRALRARKGTGEAEIGGQKQSIQEATAGFFRGASATDSQGDQGGETHQRQAEAIKAEMELQTKAGATRRVVTPQPDGGQAKA